MQDLSWIGSLSVLAPSITASLLYGKLSFAVQKRLVFLVGWYLLIEAISNYLLYFHEGTNIMPLYHLYVVVDFSLLIWIFNAILPKLVSRNIQLIGFVVLSGVFIYNWVDGELIFQFPTVLKTIQGSVLTGLCVIYFWKVMRENVETDLLKSPSFWICAGVFIYQGANIVVFASSNYLTSLSGELFYAVWSYLHTALLVVYYTLIIIAFRCQTKRIRS